MTHDTLIFYAKQIKKYCAESDDCRRCPFYSFDTQKCNFQSYPMPIVWEIPGEAAEDEDNT